MFFSLQTINKADYRQYALSEKSISSQIYFSKMYNWFIEGLKYLLCYSSCEEYKYVIPISFKKDLYYNFDILVTCNLDYFEISYSLKSKIFFSTSQQVE